MRNAVIGAGLLSVLPSAVFAQYPPPPNELSALGGTYYLILCLSARADERAETWAV